MMALDGKTIIKEEITDKDVYESTAATNNSNRRSKASATTNGQDSQNNTSGSSSQNNINSTSSSSASQNLSSSNGTSSSSTAQQQLRNCRTPDSPESARVVAPRSPLSPQQQHHQQMHHSSLAPPSRPNRNASASPVVNGATTTPPPSSSGSTGSQQSTAAAAAAVVAAAAAAAHVEQACLLGKIRKFLGSLVQLAQEVHPEVSERVRSLVLSLGSAGITIDEFRMALQKVINLPLRPYVIPLLKNHIALLQREIVALARATNQSTHQYVTNNENSVMEFSPHGPSAEYNDIFVQLDAPPAPPTPTNGVATSLVFKRRASDTLMDHHNGMQDWNDYVAAYPPAKRLHAAHNPHADTRLTSDARMAYASQPTIFDYSTSGGSAAVAAAAAAAAVAAQTESGFSSLMEKSNHRDERDLRAALTSEAQRHTTTRSTMPPAQQNCSSSTGGGGGGGNTAGGSGSGEEEWKSIHTMLNCISAMVDKTKRAITILQQRGVEPQQQTNNYNEITPATLAEIRRQTEEKVVEFKRNAEEAVNQVKRQAVIEIQRAVVAAETRAAEVMAQERLRMEKFFVEMSRYSGVGGGGGGAGEREMDNKSPSITAGQNACWNCGRKATETCSGCNLARYCGAFCQHKDWEHHHQICGTTRSTDLSTKHPSQVIPLSATIRGAIARSPPTQVQQAAQSSQQPVTASSSSIGNGGQATSLIANGIGSK